MTRLEAEATLWGEKCEDRHKPAEVVTIGAKTYTGHTPRRRLEATYCPSCGGWVEVRLQPVRLRCVGCGLEARP